MQQRLQVTVKRILLAGGLLALAGCYSPLPGWQGEVLAARQSLPASEPVANDSAGSKTGYVRISISTGAFSTQSLISDITTLSATITPESGPAATASIAFDPTQPSQSFPTLQVTAGQDAVAIAALDLNGTQIGQGTASVKVVPAAPGDTTSALEVPIDLLLNPNFPSGNVGLAIGIIQTTQYTLFADDFTGAGDFGPSSSNWVPAASTATSPAPANTYWSAQAFAADGGAMGACPWNANQSTTRSSIPAGNYWMWTAQPIDTSAMAFSNGTTKGLFSPTLAFDVSNVQSYFTQASASSSFAVDAQLSTGQIETIWSGTGLGWQHVSVALPRDPSLRLGFHFYSQPDADDEISPAFLANVIVTGLVQTN